MKSRIHFIDAARAYAIALALFSHALGDFGGWRGDTGAEYLRLLTRSATPLLICLFGMMLEVVYLPRIASTGFRPVTKRLLERSALCYLAYAVTVGAGIVGGYRDTAQGALALVFLENAHHGNILRFYAVALLLGPVVLWIRLRLGPRLIVLPLALLWLIDLAFMARLSEVDLGAFSFPGSIILGIGSHRGCPSVWHGATLIFAGMFVAGGLGGRYESGYERFLRHGIWLLVPSLVVLWALAFLQGGSGVLEGFLSGAFRMDNHIGYYASGLAYSMLILLFLAAAVPRALPPAWGDGLLRFGKAPLLSFTLGNVLLNLFPKTFSLGNLGFFALPAALGFTLLMLLLVNSSPAIQVGRLAGMTRQPSPQPIPKLPAGEEGET